MNRNDLISWFNTFKTEANKLLQQVKNKEYKTGETYTFISEKDSKFSYAIRKIQSNLKIYVYIVSFNYTSSNNFTYKLENPFECNIKEEKEIKEKKQYSKDILNLYNKILEVFPKEYKKYFNIYIGDIISDTTNTVVMIRPKFTNYYSNNNRLDIDIYSETDIHWSPVNGWTGIGSKGYIEYLKSIDELIDRIREYFEPCYKESKEIEHIISIFIKNKSNLKLIKDITYYPNPDSISERNYLVCEQASFSKVRLYIPEKFGLGKFQPVFEDENKKYSNNVYKDVVEDLVEYYEINSKLEYNYCKFNEV